MRGKTIAVAAFAIIASGSGASAADSPTTIQETRFWERHFHGQDASTREIAILRKLSVGGDGGVCAAGHIETGPFGFKRSSRPWVVRLDARGAQAWERVFESDRLDTIETVAATPEGGCLVGIALTVQADRTEAKFVLLDRVGRERWQRVLAGERSVHPAWSVVSPEDRVLVVVHQDQRDAFAAPRSLAVGFSGAGEQSWETWLPGKVTGVIASAQTPILGIWQRRTEGAVLGMTPIDPHTGELGRAISVLTPLGASPLWAGDAKSVALVEKAKGTGNEPIVNVRTLDGLPLWRATIRGEVSQVDVISPAWGGAFLVARSKQGGGSDSVALAVVTPDGIARRGLLRAAELGDGAASEIFDATRLPDGSVLVTGTSSLANEQGWRRSVWLRRLSP